MLFCRSHCCLLCTLICFGMEIREPPLLFVQAFLWAFSVSITIAETDTKAIRKRTEGVSQFEKFLYNYSVFYNKKVTTANGFLSLKKIFLFCFVYDMGVSLSSSCLIPLRIFVFMCSTLWGK